MKWMILPLLVMVVIGAGWYVVTRLMDQPVGAFRQHASEAAASVRKRGPGLVQDVAYGIEKAGEATELGAENLRERAQPQDDGS